MNSQLNFNPWYGGYNQPYSMMNSLVGNNTNNTYTPPKTDTTPLIWVQGENGAKAYPVPQGTTVFLFDSENNSFYLKTVDGNTNIPTISDYIYFRKDNLDEIQEYLDEQRKIQEERQKVTKISEQSGNFVTKDEFVQFNNMIVEQLQQIQSSLNNVGGVTNEVTVQSGQEQQQDATSGDAAKQGFNFAAVQ